MRALDQVVKTQVDGYDLAAEKGRYRLADPGAAHSSLDRGSARVEISGDMSAPRLAAARVEHQREVFTNTLDPKASPVLELGYPIAGHFVRCEAGVYLDLYLAVAQKLFDEGHECYRALLERLAGERLLLRREINTDDYLVRRRGLQGIVVPQELAALLNRSVERAFPGFGSAKTFFSSSGTEAVEAGLKLALRVKHGRLLERYGPTVEAELMRQLAIPRHEYFAVRENETVYREYPFFTIACEGAFHGRTLGALECTFSKAVHKKGYRASRYNVHLPFNGEHSDLADLLDPRPLPEILRSEGGVPALLAKGRIPRDLAAVFVVEAFQGEGGYRMARAGWLRELAALCREHEILFLADEVQTFGRTGTLFLTEQMGVVPDILAAAKSAGVGVTVSRAEYEKYLKPGWHSNTWGGGKVLDVNFAFTTIDTYLHYQDPVFEGRTYQENSRIKGEYLRSNLAWLMERHPETLTAFSGLGCMYGITVRRREQVVAAAWRRGLKLLACGLGGEEARIRLVFLTDVLTHEIDEFTRVMDGVLEEVGRE